jgi:hypothetical protein
MPRKKRWTGDSIASTIPSGARALAINDGATALTDWWCELFTGIDRDRTMRRSRLPGVTVTV